MMLLLAQDSIPVVVDILEEEDSLAVADSLVGEGNLEEEGTLAVVHIPVVVHNPVEEGTLAAADTLVVGILEEASVALQSRIEAAHADLHLSHVFLVVVVQGMVVLQAALQVILLLVAARVVVLLLAVLMVVPGCSFATPSRVPDYP